MANDADVRRNAAIDVRAIEASTLDSTFKCYPHRAPPCATRDIRDRGWNVMRGDSPAQLRLIEAQAQNRKQAQPLPVLLEMGMAGGRTGCRTVDEAMQLARAISASPSVSLSGIECYEGLSATGDSEADRIVVER